MNLFKLNDAELQKDFFSFRLLSMMSFAFAFQHFFEHYFIASEPIHVDTERLMTAQKSFLQ